MKIKLLNFNLNQRGLSFNSGEIPEFVLEMFQFFLVKVDGHRRHHGGFFTQDVIDEPLLVKYDSSEKKFLVVGDMTDSELVSKFDKWLPINMDLAIVEDLFVVAAHND